MITKKFTENVQLHEIVKRHISNLQSELVEKGFQHKVANLGFHPLEGDECAPCGGALVCDKHGNNCQPECIRCGP